MPSPFLISYAVAAIVSLGQPGDSLKAARLADRARKEELNLFVAWRNEWLNLRDLKMFDGRYFSLHCHYDDVTLDDAKHLIHSIASRKSMCPIWFQEGGTRADVSAAIDNPLSEKARQKIRDRRAHVLALLDSAAALAPANSWVLGQRVRLNVDQGDFARAAAIASTECREAPAVCALLEGYAVASGGNWAAAGATFEFAIAGMSAEQRCAYLDISPLLDPETRDRHSSLPCEQRSIIDARYWWLADPLFAQPGNERLYVHLYRQILVSLHTALVVDEHFDWHPAAGGLAAIEMLMRYGFPSVLYFNRAEHENHNGWLGFSDGVVNASREYFRPRYHTTPPYAVASGARQLERGDFDDLAAPWNSMDASVERRWWPFEHFGRSGALVTIADVQAAAFRREHASLLVVAADPRSRTITSATLASYTALLFASRGRSDTLRRSAVPAALRPTGAIPMSLLAEPGAHVISAEVVDVARDSAPAARARFEVALPSGLDSLASGEVALSEPALFSAPATDDSLPRSVADAMERMLPTTALRDPHRVGVFVEMYGVAQGTPAELTLTVVSEEQLGFWRRLGARLRLTDPAGLPFTIRWRDDQAGGASSATVVGGVVLQTRAIVLNIETLKPGKYRLVIGASRPGQLAALSSRDFSVTR